METTKYIVILRDGENAGKEQYFSTTKEKLDDMYYNDGDSPVSDQSYDLLIDIYNQKNGTSSNKIGCKVRDEDNKVKRF
mgnify:CR=1 FL=1